MTDAQPLMRIRNLHKTYPRQRVDAGFFARAAGKAWGWTGRLDEWGPLNEGLPVLKGIDLDVYPGETLAIIGPSGAGKSTLLHLLGALDLPTDGSVLYRDADLASLPPAALDRWRNQAVGFVFQFYHLFPDLDAVENVLLSAMVRYSMLEYAAKQRALVERAEALLERVGLAERRHHRPSQLSGGEQQRVAIARALLLEPELLLCDEPTGNLDRATGNAILEILWKLKEEGDHTFVIVTHDDRLSEQADRVVLMEDGRVQAVQAGGRAAGGAQPEAPADRSEEPATS